MTGVGVRAGRTVLVGVCEHPHSSAALRHAAQRAAATGADVLAVHVEPVCPPMYWYDLSAPFVIWAREAVEHAEALTCATLRGAGTSWRFEIRRGEVAAGLRTAAAEADAALVVIGTPHLGLEPVRRPSRLARALRRPSGPAVVLGRRLPPLEVVSPPGDVLSGGAIR